MIPTAKEQKAIDALERLASDWPKTLWLFCDGNGIKIMRNVNGRHKMTNEFDGGVYPKYCLGKVDIDSDGGDW